MGKNEKTKKRKVQQMISDKDYNALFYHYEYLVDMYMNKIDMHDEDTRSYIQLVLLDRIHELIDNDNNKQYDNNPSTYLHRELWRALFKNTLTLIPDQHCVYIDDVDESEFMIDDQFTDSIITEDFVNHIYAHIIESIRNRRIGSYIQQIVLADNIERDIDIFNMFYFQEKTLCEIGKKYGIVRGRVGTILTRCIRYGRHYVAKL